MSEGSTLSYSVSSGSLQTVPAVTFVTQLYSQTPGVKNSGPVLNNETTFPRDFGPPLRYRKGIPSKGEVKVPVFLVDFPLEKHTDNETANDVNNKFFGPGDPAQFPYESVNRYYYRSSYGSLNISGKVYPWYTASHTRDYYKQIPSGERILVKEVLDHFAKLGEDFSAYDNNNDGFIDCIYLKWTGSRDPDNLFWWPATFLDYGEITKVSGKSVRTFSWLPYTTEVYKISGNYTDEIYRPITDIHETGHLLGLSDYYDQTRDKNPYGGLGGWDMMDQNWGDHNAFSKYLLDWIKPTILCNGSSTYVIRPLGNYPDAVLVMPGACNGGYQEYFLVQYIKPGQGNYPLEYGNPVWPFNHGPFNKSGLMVLHINAATTGQGGDFQFSMSTAPKLLSLVEADGKNEIGEGKGRYKGSWDSSDFFTTQIFSPVSTPNSSNSHGSQTGIVIKPLGPQDGGYKVFIDSRIH